MFKVQRHFQNHYPESLGMLENQNRQLAPNVLGLFLDTVKSVIGNQQHQNVRRYHNKNETSKGIDIAFDSNMNILPAFGNKEDLKFIFLGELNLLI